MTACRCGHESHAHEHYRRGTDCAMCACARFRTVKLSPWARLLERRGVRRDIRLAPPAQPQPQAQLPRQQPLAS